MNRLDLRLLCGVQVHRMCFCIQWWKAGWCTGQLKNPLSGLIAIILLSSCTQNVWQKHTIFIIVCSSSCAMWWLDIGQHTSDNVSGKFCGGLVCMQDILNETAGKFQRWNVNQPWSLIQWLARTALSFRFTNCSAWMWNHAQLMKESKNNDFS